MNSNLAYQEEFREELIGGQPVMMSPAFSNHNRVAGNIYRIFSVHLLGRSCEPFGDGEDVYLTPEDRFVPDFMVVCDPEKVQHDGVHGAPDLVAEILSPSTARNDRGRKMEVYAKCGVKEYWLVTPGEKTIEQYLNQDGRFALNNVYALHSELALKRMNERERAAVVAHFQCTLFDDLDISLEDVFYRTT